MRYAWTAVGASRVDAEQKWEEGREGGVYRPPEAERSVPVNAHDARDVALLRELHPTTYTQCGPARK